MELEELVKSTRSCRRFREDVMVIALGAPAEQIDLIKINDGDDIRYWRDEQDVHDVPKRKLDDLLIGEL